jgi:hypothetical protein
MSRAVGVASAGTGWAADDPTRRGDLVKLLDTFPAGEAARGGMDADRLRASLGLR